MIAAVPDAEVRVAARSAVLIEGLAGAVVGAVLIGLELLGPVPLLAGVAVAQVVLVVGYLALVDAPASGGALVIGLGATVAADVVAGLGDGKVTDLGGVVALSFVAGLVHQLFRRDRSRVTEALADALVVVVLVSSAACLVAVAQLPDVERTFAAALAAAAAALLVGRLVDAAVRRRGLVVGATRGWPGVLLALVAGTCASVALGPSGTRAAHLALLGLLAAATVAATDLAVDLARADVRPGPGSARRSAAVRPVLVLLPFAALGPVALLGIRLLTRLA